MLLSRQKSSALARMGEHEFDVVTGAGNGGDQRAAPAAQSDDGGADHCPANTLLRLRLLEAGNAAGATDLKGRLVFEETARIGTDDARPHIVPRHALAVGTARRPAIL